MRVKLQGRNYIFPENLSKLDVNKSKFGFIGTPLIIERYAPNLSLLFPHLCNVRRRQPETMVSDKDGLYCIIHK